LHINGHDGPPCFVENYSPEWDNQRVGKRCPEKVRYNTRKRALKARCTMLNQNPGAYVGVYRCLECGDWHLTSRPDRYGYLPTGRWAA
jgi:hypothetical protein